jgi:hypothetical protein
MGYRKRKIGKYESTNFFCDFWVFGYKRELPTKTPTKKWLKNLFWCGCGSARARQKLAHINFVSIWFWQFAFFFDWSMTGSRA